MNILGLHFGHDGAASVVKAGRVASFVSRERQAGVKHAIGVTTHEYQLALAEAGLNESDIDAVAVTSTQGVEMLTGLIEGFSLEFKRHAKDEVPCALEKIHQRRNVDVNSQLHYQLRDLFNPNNQAARGTLQYGAYTAMCPEAARVGRGEVPSAGCLDDFISIEAWGKGHTLGEISRLRLMGIETAEELYHGFHYPLTVRLGGREVPGYFVHHHMAHAASTFYRSGFDDAAIVSHDGFSSGAGYHGGMIYFGRENRILPFMTHHLELGVTYDRVGLCLKLGHVGPAGKLMGLAPYGQPRYYDARFYGNAYDALRNNNGVPLGDAWLHWCMEQTKARGLDAAQIGDTAHITDPVNADIAASTQKLFEQSMLGAVTSAYHALQGSNLPTQRLCLTGGTALNCPANSLMARESPYDALFIEPNCGDDGLAIGSGLYVYHQLYNHALERANLPHNQSAYQGPDITFKNIEMLPGIKAEKVDAPARAAEDLQANRVIAWFEGKSEMGPRALGHRSIIANPCHAENWERVNTLKKREGWRPFAPAVLEEEAANWFRGAPVPSPYMLFTAQVKNDKLPAVTHVDGSARIQTVDASAGGYYALIRAFHVLSGVPVVLNTSFNGPRQPILETPEQAAEFLRDTGIDALYMGGHRLTRA